MDISSESVAVVTGGASGIGLALARAFAAQGARVAIADVEPEALAAALETLPAGSLGVRADVSKLADVQRLADEVLEHFGTVDVVCNNAGVSTFNTLENQTLEDWKWVLDVNLWGVIHGVHVFAPILRAHGRPAYIVNTSSVAGLVSGIPYIGPYAVSKVGVVSISETLAAELAMAQSAVKVAVLCPSATNTGVMESERNRPQGTEQRTDDAEQMRLYIRSGFTGPEGKEPAEVAGMVVDAVREDRFWVISHNDLRDTIEQRFAGILDAIPKS